jgi:ankyrin repeat protein
MKKYTFLSFVLVLCFITISLPTFSDDKAPAGLYGYGTLNSEDVPLMQAIEKGDLALVKKLIDEGTSIDVQLFNGMKPIHQAAATGQADIAQYLLEQGADVNSRMINDISPLFIAVESQHPDVLKVLLSKGAQYSGREIQLAIVNDDLDMLKLLVTTPELANLRGRKDTTLLHSAAMSGKPAIAQYLIDQGAKVDAKTDDGETPLDMATRNKEHLSDLIARGVSKEQILQQGFNYDGYDAVISILNKYKDKH